ncbi:hypothetical protein AVEN_198639-1, partial [Araneus ventricosus]
RRFLIDGIDVTKSNLTR